MHNFHDTYGHLPVGGGGMFLGPTALAGALTGRIVWSGQAYLLPFIEETARWEYVSQTLKVWAEAPTGTTATSTTFPLYGAVNPQAPMANCSAAALQLWRDAYNASVKSYLCPSDGNHKAGWVSGGDTPGRSNIMLCYGDFTANYEPASTGTAGATGLRDFARGAFRYDAVRLLAALSDGTSNTIITSEAAISEGSGAANATGPVRGGIYKSAGTAVFTATPAAGTVTHPANFSTCRDYVSETTYKTTASLIRLDLTGKNWAGGGAWVGTTMFTTILPPNSASCLSGTGLAAGHRVVQSATSNHPGGVNVGLGDGAVRFVSDTIDYGNLNAGAVTSGASNYGIWGAMGSINGGESKAL